MKYSALGLGVLALLHSAHGHVHHHGNHLSRRDTETRSCPEAKITNTVVVHVDQLGRTLSMEMKPAAFLISQDTSPLLSTTGVTLPSTSNSTSGSASTTPTMEVPLASLAPQQERGIPKPKPSNNINGPLDINDLDDMNSFDVFFPEFSNSASKRNKFGISYSPYNTDSTCKTQDEVNDDIKSLRQYSLVRIYGVDCEQAFTVTKAARRNKMKVFAGVFNIDNLDNDLRKIINAADGDWSIFHTVSIGNELVNRGQNSPAEVVGAVNSARDTLRQAGYQGPVVTVDTFNQVIDHPELCDASDYCAANCHAFFDPTQTAENAGPYVLDQARRVSEAAGGGSKKVIITESGWPSAGVPNGNAVPSRPNQEIALKSLKESFPDGGLILFSAFDDKWKTDNEGTFGTEKFWGIAELGDMDDLK